MGSEGGQGEGRTGGERERGEREMSKGEERRDIYIRGRVRKIYCTKG